MVPPSSRSRPAARRSMQITGCGRRPVELGASWRPPARRTLRANSITAHLHAQADAEERHLRLAGDSGSASILPSMPRLPKPPGTRMPSTPPKLPRPPSSLDRPPPRSSRMLTLSLVGDAARDRAPRTPTCRRRRCSMYLPTTRDRHFVRAGSADALDHRCPARRGSSGARLKVQLVARSARRARSLTRLSGTS